MDALKAIEVALRHYESQKRASKKYYDLNKDKVNTKKKEVYKKKKEAVVVATNLNINNI